MAHVFTSDVHLRLDRPERSRRFATLVESLQPDDDLTIVGDLCDFWFASRQLADDPMRCDGLRALADYRARGGRLTILLGNHDTWLGPFYEATLGARVVPEPWESEAHGIRVHAVHGHLLGARPFWKGAMESRTFLMTFGITPNVVAERLERLLDQSNEAGRPAFDRQHLALYRKYAEDRAMRADVFVFGHIHSPTDELNAKPALVVLGSWHKGGGHLHIDEAGARLRVENPVRLR